MVLIKTVSLILFVLSSLVLSSQNLDKVHEIIKLAEIYRINHGLSGLDSGSDTVFDKYDGTQFETVAKFIFESSKRQNRIVEKEFLSRPDSATLKLFHTIIMVNYNMYETNALDNEQIVQSYLEKEVIVYEQIQQYYASLFISINNKNRPFDYSDLNWKLSELGLKNEQEEAVFFLVFMDKLGSQISRFHKAIRGPNWEGIESYITSLPRINGKEYYEFDSFNFEDFEMSIYKKVRFVKDYYLPKYYDILFAHLRMMEQRNFNQTIITRLIQNSILSQKQYYQYCHQQEELNEHLK